jgi:hypothetical protein
MRLKLCVYWTSVTFVVVLICKSWTVTTSSVDIDYKRKFFHIMGLVMFVPGLTYDPSFIHLSLVVGFVMSYNAGGSITSGSAKGGQDISLSPHFRPSLPTGA